MTKKFNLLLTIIVLFFSTASYAGNSCEQKPLTPVLIAKAGEQAVTVKKALDKLNPQVAIIARVGSDLSKYNLYYSHVGFIVRDHAQGKWMIVHLLNSCGTASSKIYDEGLINFFLDDLVTMDARIIIPNPKLQTKIMSVLNSSLKLDLHNNHYNMLAYPFSTKYQNSNQWVLEIIGAAMSGLNKRQAIQHYLTEKDYVPTKISIDSLSRLGANLFRANVKFDDHPADEMSNGNYSAVTVDSISDFMTQQKLISFDKEYKEPSVVAVTAK